MILVDTSVLIGYFKNLSGIPYDKEIAIENDLYLLHDDTDFTNIAKVYGNLKIY